MEHFKERFTKWMQGRYGGDQLSLALLILCLILMVCTLPFHSPLLRLLPLIPLVLCYFRIFLKTNINVNKNSLNLYVSIHLSKNV